MKWALLFVLTLAIRLKQTPVQASLDQGQSKEERRYSQLALILFDLLDWDKDHEVKEGDGEALLRKIDKDVDGRVSIQEFRSGLGALLTEAPYHSALKDRIDDLLAA